MMIQMDQDLCSIQEVRDLVQQARKAQRAMERMTQGELDKITAAISSAAAAEAGRLAGLAVEETGFGLKADKEIKNRCHTVRRNQGRKDPWHPGPGPREEDH